MNKTLRRLLTRRAEPLKPRLRLALVSGASVVVAIMAVWAWSSSGLALTDLSITPLIVSFLVAAPLSLVLKAAEFDLSARISDQKPDRRRAMRVAVAAAIANLLPLPGSLLVTIKSLSDDGATYRSAISAGAIPGLAWLAVTGIVGGVAVAIAGSPILGLAVVAGGILIGVITSVMFRSAAPVEGRPRLAISIVLVEFGWLGVSALRLWLAAEALGLHIGLDQALALSVAGAVTVAVGFFPGGLGLRELLVAGLSPLVGIPFNAGVLMATIDRIVWLAFLAAIAVWISASTHRDAGSAVSGEAGD